MLIAQCGGTHGTGGTVAGAMHRRWVAMRGNLAGPNDQAMLDECERGESIAQARYQKTPEMGLPSPVRSVVQAHHEGILSNLKQIRRLRHEVPQRMAHANVPNCDGPPA